MSVEENKALMHRLFEESNKGKTAAMAVIDELYDANIVLHCPRGRDICGFKDFKQANEDSFDEMPDAYYTIDDMIAEGDKVAVRLTMTGTYVGKAGEAHSAGKKVTMSMITIDRVAGGKFVEEWVRYDTLGFMEQLGLVPKTNKK
jgi:predicted ester cyclase